MFFYRFGEILQVTGDEESKSSSNSAKLPSWISDIESLMWIPILSEPPLATLEQMQDGTYSMDDLLDMIAMLKYKTQKLKTS